MFLNHDSGNGDYRNSQKTRDLCRFGPDIDVFETRLWKIETTRIVIIHMICVVFRPNVDVFEM